MDSGSIVAVTGPASYQVSTEIGLLRKHVNHLRKRKHTDPLCSTTPKLRR